MVKHRTCAKHMLCVNKLLTHKMSIACIAHGPWVRADYDRLLQKGAYRT